MKVLQIRGGKGGNGNSLSKGVPGKNLPWLTFCLTLSITPFTPSIHTEGVVIQLLKNNILFATIQSL
jgi:hypothetical protein